MIVYIDRFYCKEVINESEKRFGRVRRRWIWVLSAIFENPTGD